MRAPWLMLALSLAVLSVSSATLAEDLILRQRTTLTGGPQAPPPREQTQYFSGSKMVIDDAHTRSIVDLSAKTLTVVYKRRRAYSVTSFDELRQRVGQARERLTDLPPEARAMLGMDAPVKVTPTGKTAKIAGHLAKEYEVSAGPATGSVWVTDEIAMPTEAEEWERLSASLGGPSAPGAKLAGALAGLRGVPLRSTMTVALGGDRVTSTTEVLEVREAPAPAEVLRVPPAFRKVEPVAPNDDEEEG